jgi:hypothetical protein
MIKTATLLFLLLVLPLPAAAANPHFEVDRSAWQPNAEIPLPSPPTRSQSADEEMSVDERREMQARLKLRRQLLDAHQVLSFVAAGSIIAADVVGMFNHEALDAGAPVRSELEGTLALHRALVATTVGTYFGAGITAWAAPAAYRNAKAEAMSSGKADSGDVHVALSVAHAIGMGTMMATGILMANVAKGEDWDRLLSVHTITGFTTAGLIIAAGIVIGTL